jgi:hypothetical protein
VNATLLCDAERRAGAALRPMTDEEGLSVREVVDPALYFNWRSTRAADGGRAAEEQTPIQLQLRIDAAQPHMSADVRPDNSTGTPEPACRQRPAGCRGARQGQPGLAGDRLARWRWPGRSSNARGRYLSPCHRAAH